MLDELELQVSSAEAVLRQRLGNLRALLVISLLMTESVDEQQILQLASSSAPGLGNWRIEGFAFVDGSWRSGTNRGSAGMPAGLPAQLGVFIPVLILAPVAIASATSIKT